MSPSGAQSPSSILLDLLARRVGTRQVGVHLQAVEEESALPSIGSAVFVEPSYTGKAWIRIWGVHAHDQQQRRERYLGVGMALARQADSSSKSSLA
jgi:hypothetical protein